MAQKVNFEDRILSRLDRLDRQNLQGYVGGLLHEKKRKEEILNRVGEGLLLLDKHGMVTYANRLVSLWLGPQRLLTGKTRLIEQVEEPSLRQYFLERLKRPFEETSDEFRILSPRESYVRVHWIPLPDAEGDFLVRFVNLTQERSHDEEVRRLERIESLIRLAAGVAHEIGNPLNSIQIHIELLKREVSCLPKSTQRTVGRLINVIASETRRLDQIVRSFLRAARNPPLRFRLEAVNEVLEEAVEFLRPEMNKGKIRVKLALDKNLPPFLLDRDRLRQTFINLIKNGMEAMSRGGELTFSTVKRERLCLIRFEDKGIGITEKDLPHIFEAYYTTKDQGSGLGLTQVYQAVKEHGGRIDVKSGLGKGSVFTLVLPIRQERLSLPQPRSSENEEVLR